MSEASAAEKEELLNEADALDLLAELDAEFGKKSKSISKKQPSLDERKRRNSQWHLDNPSIESAKGQLAESELSYSWDEANAGTRQPVVPEALVSYIIHQQCKTCFETSWFTGSEYVRFRKPHMRFNVRSLQLEERAGTYQPLGGKPQTIKSTILRRLQDVDPKLIQFGVARMGAEPELLPQEIEELFEETPRCPACIMLERAALDLLIAVSKKNEPELDIEITFDEEPEVEGL